ncbi:MAG: hypothetical protein OXM55_07775 [Bdellovibrionales bacterium]|nr:hypothetical protein [Bdellovibrionales bacterium]
MKKQNIYLPVLCFLLVLLHIKVQATQKIKAAPRSPCPFAFSKEEEFLSLAEKAESLGYTLNAENIKTDETLTRLQSEINEQVSSLFDKTSFASSALLKLREDIEALEDVLNKKKESSNSTRVNGVNHPLFVDELIRDPATAQVDTPYRIDWLHHPHPTYIVFGQKIIDVFFHPKKDIKTQFAIVRKNLKALQVGYAGKHGDAGIKILTLSNSGSGNRLAYNNRNRIFEIKTVGKLSGHIRWGGFIDDNFLYIVHYANNTHHNGYKHSFMMTLLNKLRAFHSVDGPTLYR